MKRREKFLWWLVGFVAIGTGGNLAFAAAQGNHVGWFCLAFGGTVAVYEFLETERKARL